MTANPLSCLHPLLSDADKPQRFTYPFDYEPHPLCRLSAQAVQEYIAAHDEIRADADNGKMFGVLVVELPTTGLGFLAAYSGLLAGRNDWPYFVPPVYDAQQPDGYFKTKEREIANLSRISRNSRPSRTSRDSRPSSSSSAPLPPTPKALSQDLQRWLFHQYQLLNARGEVKDLVDIWQSYYSREKLRQKFPLPPGGTGDCCAPKLLQYAYQQGLRPVCMAEFWWGQTTKEELRQHLNYYPACRGKCLPILTWMLQGLEVDPNPELQRATHYDIPTVYEDEQMVVVNKPSGMLSVPGRIEQYAVETVMQQRYPGSKVAHRLDMGTSGLLIVAKTMEAYHNLQEQFVKHQVRKKYIAALEDIPPAHSAVLTTESSAHSAVLGSHASPLPKGQVSLPMRPDPMNRPRQVVDREHGKRAVTNYEFLSDRLVALWPETGRTHQLRIHCAHPDGLGRPIVGDELYGTKGDRLLLHAAEIWFHHPITGEAMHLVSPVPF